MKYIFILLFLSSCQNKNKRESHTFVAQLNRECIVNVVEKHSNKNPKEIHYIFDDTVLVHEILQNGCIITKNTLIKNKLNHVLKYDSSCNLKYEERYIINDSIDDLRKRIEYDKSGEVESEGFIKGDSMYIGEWNQYHDNEIKVTYFIDNDGNWNDTAKVYENNALIGYIIKSGFGDSQFINLQK